MRRGSTEWAGIGSDRTGQHGRLPHRIPSRFVPVSQGIEVPKGSKGRDEHCQGSPSLPMSIYGLTHPLMPNLSWHVGGAEHGIPRASRSMCAIQYEGGS
jgi:hypothetical protein